MPPITAENASGHFPNPTVVWSVHVLAPYALVKECIKDRDDVENDLTYFVTTLDNGERMATEWDPEVRLGIVKAIDSIPNVYRQDWHYIGLDSIDKVLDEIVAFEQDHDFEGNILSTHHLCHRHHHPRVRSSKQQRQDLFDDNLRIRTVILNFVDGTEMDGWPGVSVINGLEKRHLPFTGAESKLYTLDSDKALIKSHLVKSHTPTPGYYDIYTSLEQDLENLQRAFHGNDDGNQEANSQQEEEEMARKSIILEGLSKLKFPLLVKPSNSSSSRGISTKSVVDTPEEAYERALETKKIWGPVYVEEYITGREYTVLVSGSQETDITVYKVLERVFRSKIPERERMLTHEMKWGDNCYGTDETVKEASWWMEICSEADQNRLQPLAKAIYASFGGNGYCRMDLREDHRTGEVFVVDVNANCSIDEDEDCAMGKILKATGLTLGQFFSILMEDAIRVQENAFAKMGGHLGLKTLSTMTMHSGTKRAAINVGVNASSTKAVRVGV